MHLNTFFFTSGLSALCPHRHWVGMTGSKSSFLARSLTFMVIVIFLFRIFLSHLSYFPFSIVNFLLIFFFFEMGLYIAQAVLASVSLMLRLEVCATTTGC